MTAQVSAIAKKCRRALRNETGIKFTLDELRALVDIGSYDLIMQAEAEEIRQTWQKTPPRSLSGNTGSTKGGTAKPEMRSEEHTSELQSLMRISYAVFCLKKKKKMTTQHHYIQSDSKIKKNRTHIVN